MSRKSKESIKRLLAIALTFVMVAGLLPFTSVSAYAEETPAPDQTTDLVEPTDGQPKQTDGTEDIKDEPTPLDAGDTTTDPTTDPVVTMNPVEGLVYKKDVAQELLESVNVQPGYTVEKYTVVKDGDSTTSTDYTDIADIKATDAGRYTITATYKADGATVPETVECTVDIAKAQQTITFSNDGTADTVINTEETIALDFNNADSLNYTAFVNEQYEQGDGVGKISFALKASDDTEIESPAIAYDDTGKFIITFTKVGEYQLIATVKGDDNHDGNTASLRFEITDKNKDENSIITANDASQIVKLEGKKFSFNADYVIDKKYRGYPFFVTAELIAPEGITEKFSAEVISNAVKITAKKLDDIDGLIGTNIQLKITLNKWGWFGSSSEITSKTINITLNYGTKTLSESDYSISEPNKEWYGKDDTVALNSTDNTTGITICDKLSGDFKRDNVTLPQGIGAQIFVKDSDGTISKCTLTHDGVPVKVDYTAPTIELKALEGNSIFDTIWKNITFGTAGEGDAYTDDGKYKLHISASDNIELADVRVAVKTTSLQEIKTALEDETGKPAAPGEGATTEENEAYNAALAEWTVGKINESLEKHTTEFPYTDDCVGKIKFETDLSVDANQICQIEYWAVDKAGNGADKCHIVKNFDNNGNIYEYLLIDNTAPKITLTCGDKTVVEPDQDGVDPVKYYTDKSYIDSIVATVEEDNYEFSSDVSEVLTLSVKDKDNTVLSSIADTEKGKSVEIEKLTLPDANSEYTVTATCTDANGNATTITMTLVVDTTDPVPSIALPEKAIEDGLVKEYKVDANTFYFFNKDLALVLNAGDDNPGTKMTVTPGNDAASDEEDLADGKGTHTVKKEGEYKFTLDHTDAAGNSGTTDDTITYILDKTAPKVKVDLGGAARVEGNTHYYNRNITGTIKITEKYFDATLITVTGAANDGFTKKEGIDWTRNITITGDREHRLSVSGSDKAGNEMEAYNSPRLVIDTTIHAPVIGGVANGKAYKDKDIAVNVTGDDTNLDAITVKITKATKDGTETVYSVSEANRSFTYAVPAGQAADGVYTVEATIRDKANNTAAAQTVTFTVNRFGSVYEFGAGVSDINGSHVKAVDNDIVISEYSVNKLKTPLEDNVKISINGKPVSSADVKVQEEHRAGGWYKYTYVIAATSFADDGYYKVEVSSTDSESGKTSGTARYADMGLAFFKDGTKPMIESVLGMEKPTYNENEHSIDFDVYDAIGLASVKVYVDGKEVFSQTDFEDASAFSGKIVLGELSSRQHIRFEIEDLAGNITNTDDDIEPFAPEFEFVPDITVSTNFFVRWYAQPGLFWGTVIGGAALVALVVILIAKKKKTGGEEE